MHIEAHLLRQQTAYQSPYDETARGFRDYWWLDPFARAPERDHLPYSFTGDESQEVARALLRTRAGFTDLEDAGVELPRDAIAVDFIEVRADLLHPRRGVGTQVIRRLEQLYPDHTLYAFSEKADDFWFSTGWSFTPRRDGRTSSYRPLFILWRV